ncbi:MAG: hypothetical protein QOE14_2867, partial [Humisphaera sp.]|nr:hypothetical protein [Humisphaera sp.]
KLGDTRGAIAAYEHALRLNPSFDQARRNLDRVRGINSLSSPGRGSRVVSLAVFA